MNNNMKRMLLHNSEIVQALDSSSEADEVSSSVSSLFSSNGESEYHPHSDSYNDSDSEISDDEARGLADMHKIGPQNWTTQMNYNSGNTTAEHSSTAEMSQNNMAVQ